MSDEHLCLICASTDPCGHLQAIEEAFEHDDPGCQFCRGSGIVCEDHPGRPWIGDDGEAACCGAAGMPCPRVPA